MSAMAYTKLLFFAAAWCLVVCRPDGVGKSTVDIESAPYVASVHIGYGKYKGSLISPAVIIHEQFVVTVASSLLPWYNSSSKSFNVVVGTTGVGDSDGSLYEVDKTVFHHNYKNDSINQEYNIAVLKLAQPLTIGPKVQTINHTSEEYYLTQDELVTITGWFDELNSANYELTFRQEQVAFYDENTCNNLCDSTNLGISPTENQLCAAFYCRDLSAREGAALTYNGYLIGIKSIFRGCNLEAAVYLKLSSVACWIDAVIDESL